MLSLSGFYAGEKQEVEGNVEENVIRSGAERRLISQFAIKDAEFGFNSLLLGVTCRDEALPD